MSEPSQRFMCLMRGALAAALAVASILVSLPGRSAEQYPKPIQGAIQAGVKVEKQFPAASGLTGWVLSREGQYSVVYTTPDHKTLLAGTLIGEDGRNLSAEYEDKHLPTPDRGALFGELEKSAYVIEGTRKNPKSVLYVFVDPNCPFCNYTWKALQPYEKAGLQVRWVLVGMLGPTSLPKAIEVLAAPDPGAAFRKMEENFGKPWSASRPTAPTSGTAENIQKNGTLMARFGVGGTPGLVWKDAKGTVNVKGGMPRLSELPGITGLPEQRIDDPSLARFR